MVPEELQKLVGETPRSARPNREKNIFSVGGCGYYEDPASDLLAFFLDPSEEHGLGDLLLSCLIECLPDPRPFPPELEGSPERNHVTEGKNLIDIVLDGSGWVIALENKLKAPPNNPFEGYRTSVEQDERFAGKQKHFVILAPYNPEVKDWTWVEYRTLLAKVRGNLGARVISSGISKWTMLLREFLINLEEQLGEHMDDDKFNFVRDNYSAVVEVRKLYYAYLQRLRERVDVVATETLGAEPARISQIGWPKDVTTVQVLLRRDREHKAVLLVKPDGDFRTQLYVQGDKVAPGVERSVFSQDGTLADWDNESGGRIWCFGGRDEPDFDSALATFRKSLLLLRRYTQ